MNTELLIKELDNIRDDVYWTSKCGHEDALLEGLIEAEERLARLIAKLREAQ